MDFISKGLEGDRQNIKYFTETKQKTTVKNEQR